MRLFIIIVGICFLGGCKDLRPVEKSRAIPQNSEIVTIQLLDSLGYVDISMPKRYDTSFNWIHTSDCPICSKQKHRYQPATLIVFKESGFFYSGEPKDSVEHFTLFYSNYHPDPHPIDSAEMEKLHPEIKYYYQAEHHIIADSVEKINDRYFSVIASEDYDTSKKQFQKRVLAETSVKGTTIKIEYLLVTKLNDSICNNFIKKFSDALKNN